MPFARLPLRPPNAPQRVRLNFTAGEECARYGPLSTSLILIAELIEVWPDPSQQHLKGGLDLRAGPSIDIGAGQPIHEVVRRGPPVAWRQNTSRPALVGRCHIWATRERKTTGISGDERQRCGSRLRTSEGVFRSDAHPRAELPVTCSGSVL
jgi:hypothetical protein